MVAVKPGPHQQDLYLCICVCLFVRPSVGSLARSFVSLSIVLSFPIGECIYYRMQGSLFWGGGFLCDKAEISRGGNL